MAEVSLVPSIGPAGVVAGIALTLLAGLLIEQLVHYISWRYKRATAGVAAIFAPIITSSPELAIFLVALIGGELQIAWGSIVAQPFMAATVIYPILILTTFSAWLLKRRRFVIPHVHRAVALPLLVFTIPLLPILFLHPEKHGVLGQLYGLFLIAVYFLYAKYMLKEEESKIEKPSLWLRNWVLQTFIAIVAIAFGSEWMVSGIRELGASTGIDKVALSVILVPIATAIPESVVALIFLAKGKDDEGVNSVIGEKALYGTFYPGLAMALGVYTLEPAAALALILAIAVSIVEILLVWFYGRFGLSTPLGAISYGYYVACYTLHMSCPLIG